MNQQICTSSDLTVALFEVAAAVLCASLLKGVSELDAVTVDQHVNEALAGIRNAESLGADALARYQDIIAKKTGEKLASAARLANDSLGNGTGYSVWISSTHDRAIHLFNRALDSHASGRKSGSLRNLLVAQTFLISVTHSMGLLGMPLKGAAKKRTSTASRQFLPEDYPDREVRAAIVEMAFNDDTVSTAYLRSLCLKPEYDRDGRISQLVAAYQSSGDLLASVRLLAGHIIADEPEMFSVSRQIDRPRIVRAVAIPAGVPVSLMARAQAAALGAP